MFMSTLCLCLCLHWACVYVNVGLVFMSTLGLCLCQCWTCVCVNAGLACSMQTRLNRHSIITRSVLLFILIISRTKRCAISAWSTMWTALGRLSSGRVFTFNRLGSDDKLPQINSGEIRRLRRAPNNALFNATRASVETRQISESRTVNKFRVRRRQITYDVCVDGTPIGTRLRFPPGFVAGL